MTTNKSDNTSGRRRFVKSLAAIPMFTAGVTGTPSPRVESTVIGASGAPSLKVSLNAFSFNGPLNAGQMTIDDMMEFCSEKKFYAVDITAYYFPGYPAVPSDEYLYHIKRKAFSLGLEISGTGVRNDFTEPDEAKRRESIMLVKNWIEAAEKIGAPVIRIFSGNKKTDGIPRSKVMEWMINDIRECVAFGKKHGVVVAIQNHNDFIMTADDAITFIDTIKDEWFGLILDTGSYRAGDPYVEIEKTARYAVNWQIKEKVFEGGKEVDVDMDRLIRIIKASGYKGYIPLETLGEGDPKLKITALLDRINRSLANV